MDKKHKGIISGYGINDDTGSLNLLIYAVSYSKEALTLHVPLNLACISLSARTNNLKKESCIFGIVTKLPMRTVPKLHFKSEVDDIDTEMKGYRNDVFVEMPNGDIVEVFFYDPARLTNDLGDGIYLSQPGLIILNTVTTQSIEKAVLDLWKKGYFNYFKPVSSLKAKHFDEEI